MAMQSIDEQKKICTSMRKNIISMLEESGSGHPGGSLSIVEIITSLYFGGVMEYDLNNIKGPESDRFILSKGHAAPALYALFVELGFIKEEELKTLRKFKSRLQGHPCSLSIPEIEVSTGSLGQGFSIACGLAHGLKISGSDKCVFTILGDGETEEGQVWEAAQFASHYQLNNLVAIVDNNGLQIDGPVEKVGGYKNIAEKFEAFGWQTTTVNGHDLNELFGVLMAAKASHMPFCVIANTVKGKGVSFMENQVGWHGTAPNAEQAAQALKELKEVE